MNEEMNRKTTSSSILDDNVKMKKIKIADQSESSTFSAMLLSRRCHTSPRGTARHHAAPVVLSILKSGAFEV
uniref:Uncharacterized protein n=1 Tax=Romanomermis culicivorax TaxID=13658 RepID=A0A915KY42_ROMCU